MSIKIAPSVLSANFLALQKDIEMINNSVADLIHVDIMDGNFVPNISFGADICKSIFEIAKKPLDVHLMVIRPEDYVDSFYNAGAKTLSIHLEATHNAHRCLTNIKAKGMLPGLAINPQTPISMVKDLLPYTGQVIIMGVNPGFGGQSLIEQSYYKLEELREIIVTNNYDVKVMIDGGVSLNTAQRLIDSGADILVAGSAVFKADNPTDIINQLQQYSTK